MDIVFGMCDGVDFIPLAIATREGKSVTMEHIQTMGTKQRHISQVLAPRLTHTFCFVCSSFAENSRENKGGIQSVIQWEASINGRYGKYTRSKWPIPPRDFYQGAREMINFAVIFLRKRENTRTRNFSLMVAVCRHRCFVGMSGFLGISSVFVELSVYGSFLEAAPTLFRISDGERSGLGSSKPDWANPGLVKFFISSYDPATTSFNPFTPELKKSILPTF